MRRKLDILSEIRLRCASGCKPKLWKFEWILNWEAADKLSRFFFLPKQNESSMKSTCAKLRLHFGKLFELGNFTIA